MKTRIKAASIVLAATLTAFSSVAVLAEGFPGAGKKQHCRAGEHGMMMDQGQRGDHVPPYLRGVELTAAQRDQIFDLTYKQMPEQRKLQQQMHDVRQQLMTMTLTPDFDNNKAKQLVATQTELQGKLLLNRIQTDNRIYQLLTEEQRKQLAERKQPEPRAPKSV